MYGLFPYFPAGQLYHHPVKSLMMYVFVPLKLCGVDIVQVI